MSAKDRSTKIERSREAYRGASLIARTYGASVRGKAWCDGRELASIEGLSEEDVLATLRQLVDEAFTIESNVGSISYPGEEAYLGALRASSERLTEKYRHMLKAHYDAPDRTLTLPELAEAAGYPKWTTANTHYGKVGRMVGEHLLFQPRKSSSGDPIWVLILAEGADDVIAEEEWQWRMRDQVAVALEAVGIV